MFRTLPVAALALAAFASTTVHAEDTRSASCSNASLNGAYSFTSSGFVLPSSLLPAPLVGPFASLGTASYDGAGNVTLNASASFNGLTQAVNADGTYRVNPDCTFTSRLANGVTFYGVITGSGDELMVQQTTPGTVISGAARHLRPGRDSDDRDDRGSARCHAASISRPYGFIATGFGLPPYVPPELSGPQSGVGIVRFDPRGTFTIAALSSTNGTIDAQPQVLSGSYQLSESCVLTMQADVGLTFSGRVHDGGRSIQVVETDAGATVLVRTRSVR